MLLVFNYHQGIMLKLKSYQEEAIQVIYKTFTESNRQYIEMPTGSGKTITFLAFANKYHHCILIIVPSKQLLRQVYESALKFYDKKDISRKGDIYNESIALVHICIINSIKGDYLTKISNTKFDLMIIDEAHHTQSDSYKRLIKSHDTVFVDTKILGVTATPDRLDKALLNEILYICSFRLSTEEMISAGYLCDIEGYSVKTKIDLTDVDHHNGDFSLKQLYNKLCVDSRNQMILDICTRESIDRKTIIFCININHSKKIHQLLKEKGFSSAHLDGTNSNQERQVILEAFRNGEISFLCNCQLLTEGFDEPSIDCVILARPTKSKALFTQMIGRGLRLFPGKKNCKIIDIVDNHKVMSGFNCLVTDRRFPQMSSFKSFSELRKHVDNEALKITEFELERTDILTFEKKEVISSSGKMIQYLIDNDVLYFEPLSFDEASFLVWHNELKKEFDNGNNN
jgi:superfamily II DNA or RNA helicase